MEISVMGHKFNLAIVCLLLWLPFTLSGQRSVSGRITDAADGSPIPAVTVFLANTAVGISTDNDGKYRLNIPGEGSYQLKVSHVGYQPVTKDIEPGNKSVEFNVALQSIELGELTVATKVKFRRTDISLFWRTILGRNPSTKTIQATNPEAVYYYYNPETKQLKVTCREPLQIVNYETGYQIQYFLDWFTHDYNTKISDWSHQCVFTELEPQNLKQKDTWLKNRKKIYDISLIKFIKSLYNNTLKEDGFILANYRLNPNADSINKYSLSILTQDSILSPVSTGNGKTLNLSDRQILLFCYGKPVTKHDSEKLWLVQNPNPTPVVNRYYRGGYFLTQQPQMDKQLGNIGLYRNLLLGDSIRIFPDGTYSNRIRMSPVNSSETLLGLSLSLPLDYLPDESAPPAMAENTIDFDSIAQQFSKQLSVFPQEKIHLHTDRDVYASGENIRFRAYVADALTHQPSTESRYVYVELISPVDTLVNRVMVRQEEGLFYGYMPVAATVPEGNYTLRAYTRYMENLGDDYFFKKNIRIGSLKNNYELKITNYEKETSSGNRKNDLAGAGPVLAQNDYDVSFFPEGGNLLEGVLCKVAFKALNSNGYAETVSGELVDEKGAKITAVETFYSGMGVFSFIPEPGKKYRMKCRNSSGLEKQFDLPKPDPCACALSVSQHNNKMLVNARISPKRTNSLFYLLAQCRGEVLYFSEWDQKNEYISFSAEEFPSGIIQFMLFDARMTPLSERLVFNKNNDDVAKIAFQTDKKSYGKREKVIATIRPPLTPPEEGNIPSLSERGQGVGLSVSITDDRDIAPDSATTILSSLLLSSELKGYIENPAYYLQDDIKSTVALDYLMLTHGWRRYNTPEVVKGNTVIPSIPYQTGYTFAGSVKNLNLLRSGPVSGSEVIMMAERDIGTTSTDGTGRFTFRDFEYPDSTKYFIQALGSTGSNRVELVLDRDSFPSLIHAPQSPYLIPTNPSPTSLTPTLSKGEGVETDDYPSQRNNDFIAKAAQRSKYDENMRMIQLSEIEVRARRIEKKDEPRLHYWANVAADVTIRREEIEKKFKLRLVSDVLQHIPGIIVATNGAISIRQGPLPLVLIDGMPVPWDKTLYEDATIAAAVSPVNIVSVQDVESIDIFEGVGASVFGARGFGGAISITTKSGITNKSQANPEFNYTVYTPLGYQKPVEFYAPKYETLQAKQSPIPDLRTTIFWKPDIVISDEQEEISFEFYTSDFPTTYSVVIEGLTTDGKIVRQVERIKVE